MDSLLAVLQARRVPGRSRIIWLITDGGDNASGTDVGKVKRELQNDNTALLVIRTYPGTRATPEQRDWEPLHEISEDSGGFLRYVVTTQGCASAAAALAAYPMLAITVNTQIPDDRKKHSLQLVTNKKGERVLRSKRNIPPP